MKNLEELRTEIKKRYGNFELSQIKNESNVESILDFVLQQIIIGQIEVLEELDANLPSLYYTLKTKLKELKAKLK